MIKRQKQIFSIAKNTREQIDCFQTLFISAVHKKSLPWLVPKGILLPYHQVIEELNFKSKSINVSSLYQK